MLLDLSIASMDEKPLLQRMMQLYQYDFSEIDGSELDDEGIYSYQYLDLYWTEENRTPLIIRAENHLAGFVLVNKRSHTEKGRFCIAEFFIM